MRGIGKQLGEPLLSDDLYAARGECDAVLLNGRDSFSNFYMLQRVIITR